MKPPKNGIPKCCYMERKGHKNYRLKQEATISDSESSLIREKAPKPTNIITCNEGTVLKSAVLQILNFFKFVQENTSTLKSCSESLFDSPIL